MITWTDNNNNKYEIKFIEDDGVKFLDIMLWYNTPKITDMGLPYVAECIRRFIVDKKILWDTPPNGLYPPLPEEFTDEVKQHIERCFKLIAFT